MTNSEPSRLDRIEAAIEAHDRQIELLFQAQQMNQELNTQILQSINILQNTVREGFTRLTASQELYERRLRDLEQQAQESDQRHRENEERFNVLLEEIRFLVRRMDDRSQQ